MYKWLINIGKDYTSGKNKAKPHELPPHTHEVTIIKQQERVLVRAGSSWNLHTLLMGGDSAALWKTVQQFLNMLKTELLCDPTFYS